MKLPHEPFPDYLANPALRAGQIAAFLKSPLLFKDQADGIAKLDTPAATFGTTAHMAYLEPHRFRNLAVIKPAKLNFSTKAGKAWRADHAGALIVTAEDYGHIQRMHERMPARIRALFNAAECECTHRNELGQCRSDLWIEKTRGHGITANFKTIDDIDNWPRAIVKYSYHIAAMWYRRVIFTDTGTHPRSLLIFAEKKSPYRWREVDLDPDFQKIADRTIDTALAGIARCRATGDWSDPAEADPRAIASPPAWLGDEAPTFPDEEEEP